MHCRSGSGNASPCGDRRTDPPPTMWAYRKPLNRAIPLALDGGTKVVKMSSGFSDHGMYGGCNRALPGPKNDVCSHRGMEYISRRLPAAVDARWSVYMNNGTCCNTRRAHTATALSRDAAVGTHAGWGEAYHV